MNLLATYLSTTPPYKTRPTQQEIVVMCVYERERERREREREERERRKKQI